MAAYRVGHAYSAFRDGQRFGPWAEGDSVELEPGDAAWVNRDSPGCLKPAAEPEAEPKPERRKPAGANRQHRGGRNRQAGS